MDFPCQIMAVAEHANASSFGFDLSFEQLELKVSKVMWVPPNHPFTLNRMFHYKHL